MIKIGSVESIKADFIIIGAGIAGSSAAYRLSKHGKVVLLEKESSPSYHTTGRSAAFFTENYGNKNVRAITRASKEFLENPPKCFGNNKLLLNSGGSFFIANKNQEDSFEKELKIAKSNKANIFEISCSEAIKKVSILKKNYIHRVLVEPEAKAMDVDLIHQGFLRGFKNNNGQMILNSEVTKINKIQLSYKLYSSNQAFVLPSLFSFIK